jgi:hypothetical protein
MSHFRGPEGEFIAIGQVAGGGTAVFSSSP